MEVAQELIIKIYELADISGITPVAVYQAAVLASLVVVHIGWYFALRSS